MNKIRAASFGLVALASIGCITAYIRREEGGRQLETSRVRLIGADAATGNYIVKRGNNPIGIGKLAYAVNGDTVEVREDMTLWIPVPGGKVQQARQVATTFLDGQLQVLKFEILIEAGGEGENLQRSIVRGKRISKDSMELSILTGGQEQKVRERVPSGFAIGQSLWPRLAISGALLVGNTFQAAELDALSLSVRPQEIKVLSVDSIARKDLPEYDPADTRTGYMKIYSVEQKSNGLVYKLKIRQDGLPLRTDLPAGMVIVQSKPEEVGRLMGLLSSQRAPKEMAAEGDDGTLIGASAIQAGVPTVGTGLIGSLGLIIQDMAPDNDMDGGSQKVSGDTVRVRQGNLRMGKVVPDPRFVNPEPFIESNEPEIKQAALAATSGSKNQAEQVQRTVHWVWGRLAKVYVASLPSALQTLRAKEGDCTEHTVLTTAMLRSLGIPARPVTGLAYVQGSWFYHAWVEVDLGYGWEPVDPTFDEAPASAGRIRLFARRDGMSRILPLVGNLKLRVFEATRAKGLHSVAAPADPAGQK